MHPRLLATAGVGALLAGLTFYTVGPGRDATVEPHDGGLAPCGALMGGVRLCEPCDGPDLDDTPCGQWVAVLEADGGQSAPVCVEREGHCADGGL